MMNQEAKDRKHLDYLYSPSKWVRRTFPEGEDVISHFARCGLAAKDKILKQFPSELSVVYGNGKNTKMDIYFPNKLNNENKNVLIFIHGGYWQEGSIEYYALLASYLNDLDCILVMVEYDLAPDASMDVMVAQVKDAVVFTAKKFPSSRLFLCGHSAGGHLSAMMMTVDWRGTGVAPNRFAGIYLISGLFDLEPLLSTYVNEPIKMDFECASRNSPMKIIQSRGLTVECKVLVVIAEYDSPPFHEQSKDFYNLLKEKLPQHSVEYLEIPEVDHFDIMEKCVERDFTLNKVILNFMKVMGTHKL